MRKVRRAIAEKLTQAGLPLDRRSQRRLSDDSVLWIDTREYEPDIYRNAHRDPPEGYRTMNRLSELSFIETDLALIDGTDLAGFLACLQQEDAEQFRWPLFSQDKSYPTYAWTRAAEAFYYDRHKERLRCEQELNRRQKAASTT